MEMKEIMDTLDEISSLISDLRCNNVSGSFDDALCRAEDCIQEAWYEAKDKKEA